MITQPSGLFHIINLYSSFGALLFLLLNDAHIHFRHPLEDANPLFQQFQNVIGNIALNYDFVKPLRIFGDGSARGKLLSELFGCFFEVYVKSLKPVDSRNMLPLVSFNSLYGHMRCHLLLLRCLFFSLGLGLFLFGIFL